MGDHSRLPRRGGFRQRGTEITRLETFTDAAFAFAVTVLVIAGGEVPDSYAALIRSLHEVPAFATSFALIVMFWHGHVQWSRRYGLEDSRAVLLSAALIFTVLIYVVPLKVLFGQMFSWMTGGALGQPFRLTEIEQLPSLFVVYGLGYVGMTSIMTLLYALALSRREALQLDPHETFLTRVSMWQWVLLGLPGVLSVAVAAMAPPAVGVWSGFAYAVLPVLMPIYGIRTSRRAQALGFEPRP